MLYNRLTEAWTSEGLFSKNSAFWYKKRREGCWCCVMWGILLENYRQCSQWQGGSIHGRPLEVSQAPPTGQTTDVQNLRSRSSSMINNSSFVLGSELPRFDYCFWLFFFLFVCCCRREQIMTWEGVGVETDSLSLKKFPWTWKSTVAIWPVLWRKWCLQSLNVAHIAYPILCKRGWQQSGSDSRILLLFPLLSTLRSWRLQVHASVDFSYLYHFLKNL